MTQDHYSSDHLKLDKDALTGEEYQRVISKLCCIVYRHLIDGNQTMVFLSDYVEILTGYPASDFLFNRVRTYSSIIHPEDKETRQQRMMAALQNDECFSIEYRILHKNGKEIWVAQKGRKEFDPSKNQYFIEGMIVDITDFKEEYETVFNHSQDAIFIITVNKDGSFTYLRTNKTHQKETGITLEHIRGKTPQELAGNQLGKFLTSNYSRCINERKTIFYEEELELPAGKKTWATSLTPVFREGKPLYIIGASKDVTNERQSENELKAAKEELERYFTSSLDLLCITNTDGIFLRLNPEWEEVLGYSVEHLAQKQFLDYVHPEDIENTKQAVAKLSGQQEVLNFINRYRCKDGSYRWIEWRSKPQGHKIYAVARDITDKKRTEEFLKYQNSFQLLVSSIASKFVSAQKGELYKVMQEALSKVCDFFGIDHSFIFSYNKEVEVLIRENEWTATGEKTETDRKKETPISELSWFFKQLQTKPYYMTHVDELPEEAKPEEISALSKQAKTLLFYPLSIEKRLLGATVFFSVNQKKDWSQDEILQLGVITKLIAEVAYRIQQQRMIIKAEQKSTAMAMIITANHEINQPLTIIRGYTDKLQNKFQDAEYDNYFGEIYNSIEKIQKIIESMSRIKQIDFEKYIDNDEKIKLPKN